MIIKRVLLSVFTATIALASYAQGWPDNYGGVMLQGFYWNSFSESQWTALEEMAPDLKGYFDLVWVPQSGKTNDSESMGYDPYYYFDQNSSFGTEAQLRHMISTFKQSGIGTIADVVVNHRNTTGWFSFPAETYNGVTYQMLSTDIVRDDDGGKAKAEADREGVQLSSNYDEGEGFDGMRDLDHKSQNVQTIVKAYTKFLIDDIGYTGFRYDVAKGFAPVHIADYNNNAHPAFSVAEVFDGDSKIKSVINGSSNTTAAFDFQFRYVVQKAFNANDLSRLNMQNDGNWPLVSSNNADGSYRRYAVTFLENHDTELRTSGETQDPLRRDTLAANAYMLAMPGTPCVFYRHYAAYPNDIKAMIDARKAVGITNTSSYSPYGSVQQSSYAAEVTGNNGKLLVVLGNRAVDDAQYVKVLSGKDYAYYLGKSLEQPFADRPSGTYSQAFDVVLTAVSTHSDAQLVYTLDGSEPTSANGRVVASGTRVHIAAGSTLRVGLLVGGSVVGTISRDYRIEAFQPYDIRVYVHVNATNWNTAQGLNFWTWGGDGTHGPQHTTWPGDRVSQKENIGGKEWFVSPVYTIHSATDAVSFVFSAGSGSPQTVNVSNVRQTSYYDIEPTTTGSNYNVTDVTAATGIREITADKPMAKGCYTLGGQRISRPSQPGIYIIGGRKVSIR